MARGGPLLQCCRRRQTLKRGEVEGGGSVPGPMRRPRDCEWLACLRTECVLQPLSQQRLAACVLSSRRSCCGQVAGGWGPAWSRCRLRIALSCVSRALKSSVDCQQPVVYRGNRPLILPGNSVTKASLASGPCVIFSVRSIGARLLACCRPLTELQGFAVTTASSALLAWTALTFAFAGPS